MIRFKLQPNDYVLFQGDSITEAGRRDTAPPMGVGYASMLTTWLTARYPEMNWRFENRGVAGDGIAHLLDRWEKQCVILKPTIVSILVGINDTWRYMDGGHPVSVEAFVADYRELLTVTRQKVTDRIVLMEPFSLPTPPDRARWRIDLDPKIQVVRNLAREFSTAFIPLDGLFARAATFRPMVKWLHDGVHPTPEGHALIAQEWMRALGLEQLAG